MKTSIGRIFFFFLLLTNITWAAITNEEISSLFDHWNEALQSGNAKNVAELYAPDAMLLPTVSNNVYQGREAIETYF